jgi:hypothetical protein
LIGDFLQRHSLPVGVSVEQTCFSHLENRVRPQIVETNMPWWLAAIIASPLVAISLWLIRRYREKKAEERRIREE